MPPIPDFNHNNVLPPHLGHPTNAGELSPYPSTILEFCHRFATSPERIDILKGFLYFRLESTKHGIISGFQWIDGSFIENIEVSENRPPHDIDAVSFVGNIDDTSKNNIVNNFRAFIDTKLSKAYYKVDHYIVEYDKHPLDTVYGTKYWIQLFSHNRDGVWKGMIQIPLYSDSTRDNEALNFLNGL